MHLMRRVPIRSAIESFTNSRNRHTGFHRKHPLGFFPFTGELERKGVAKMKRGRGNVITKRSCPSPSPLLVVFMVDIIISLR